MDANKYKVTIGTPARRRSTYVVAADADSAVAAAIEKLVAADMCDREWAEKYAANRDSRTGTCQVEQA